MSERDDRQQSGIIFNIQKYSVHDGPGIRTVVFLKGCPLSCTWCSNPESQVFAPELAYNQGKCIGLANCGHCQTSCPHGAILPGEEEKISIDRAKCRGCVEICTQACPPKALIPYGYSCLVNEAVNSVEQDMQFYARSGGGMTLSGGEPLAQKNFALALLREAKKRRIKTCIETCGVTDTETMLEAAGLLNNMMFDLKHINSAAHAKGTGLGNERIIQNLSAVLASFPKLPVVVRTPVVPGFNDTEECIGGLAELIKKSAGQNAKVSYELLAYHRLGTQKYQFLGREYPLADARLEDSVFEKLRKVAAGIMG